MKVLGIDQATHTGFAVAEPGVLHTSGTKVLRGAVAQRFSEFAAWFGGMIKTHLPDLVVYEKPHFRGYDATLSGVGLIALIQMICYETGTKCIGVHTATLKKFATGYGKASKTEMTTMANRLEGLSLETKENNDEADAIHLALYGVNECQSTKTITK